MTAAEMVIKRTGMSEDDAAAYVEWAESRIRSYLHSFDVSSYTYEIAEIAVLLYQMDASAQNSAAALGYSSVSYSEGGVSKSVSGMTGAAIRTEYETAIRDILSGLDGKSGKVVFL